MNKVERSALAALLATMVCALPLRALAGVGVVQLYSTPDGEYQAILLEDDEDDGVDRFTGLNFLMSDLRGTSRWLALTPKLVSDREVVVDGRRRFLIATRRLSLWLRAQALLPDAFLAIDGGTLSISPASPAPWIKVIDMAYAMPLDPVTGKPVASIDELARHPRALPDPQSAPDAHDLAKIAPAPVVREYYHPGLDRYFLAATQVEKADLDFGRRFGWQRTGKYFRSLDADATHGAVTVPVCRYYLPPPLGDTHFFSAFAEECEAVARQWPSAILETQEAFRAGLPEATTGSCVPVITSGDPQDALITRPVYRVWSGLADGSHRYTTSLAEQSEMVSRGWIPEGYGPHGTAMCVDAYDVGTVAVPKQKPKPPRGEGPR